jgi:CHASE3 domain sensor protein
MDQEEFLQKLGQIEEQAQLTLAEFPKTLTKERQRMIIALVRYIRSEADRNPLLSKAQGESEALARLRSA